MVLDAQNRLSDIGLLGGFSDMGHGIILISSGRHNSFLKSTMTKGPQSRAPYLSYLISTLRCMVPCHMAVLRRTHAVSFNLILDVTRLYVARDLYRRP